MSTRPSAQSNTPVEYVFSNLYNPLAPHARNSRISRYPLDVVFLSPQLISYEHENTDMDAIGYVDMCDEGSAPPPPEYSVEDPLLGSGRKSLCGWPDGAVGIEELDVEANRRDTSKVFTVYNRVRIGLVNFLWRSFVLVNNAINIFARFFRCALGYQESTGVAILINTETIIHQNDDPSVANNFSGPVSCSYS